MPGITPGRRALLVVLLTAAALAWVLSRGPDDLMYRPDMIKSHDPDYSLSDFTVSLMDKQGLPAYRVLAKSMEHYPDDGMAYWTHPEVSFYTQGKVIWTIDADKARSPDEGDTINLEGDVRMRQVGDRYDLKEVTAQEMTLYTRERVIESDGIVNLVHGAGQTRGTGLRVELQNRRIRLLSNVRGEYHVSGG